MAMGRQSDRQGELMVMWSEMPRSPGHMFYDRLQEVGPPHSAGGSPVLQYPLSFTASQRLVRTPVWGNRRRPLSGT